MASNQPPGQPGLVKSALRVLDLFELFEDQQHPMRVTEIAERLTAPQSSVSALLKTLRARGYLDFNTSTRCYSPSARLSFLGDWAVGNYPNRGAIQDVMRRLANETHESVLLGRRNGIMMQYLAVIESRRELRLVPHTGIQRPLHHSAIGIVLLAETSDDAIGRTVRRYNAELGAKLGVVDESEVMQRVHTAREAGYYRTLGLVNPGAGVLAKVLPSTIAAEPMAIGIAAPIDRLQEQTFNFLDALQSAVKSI
ncbi:MAG: helix-turn-helix domain-containing protein [Burkholderiaceae bacterium]